MWFKYYCFSVAQLETQIICRRTEQSHQKVVNETKTYRRPKQPQHDFVVAAAAALGCIIVFTRLIICAVKRWHSLIHTSIRPSQNFPGEKRIEARTFSQKTLNADNFVLFLLLFCSHFELVFYFWTLCAAFLTLSLFKWI